MNVRRPMAAAIAVLGLPVMSLGLTACGFNVQTNEVYNPPVGVNEPFGFISTLNVAIVSDTDGAGTLITTFNNYDTQNDDELVDIAGEGLDFQISGDTVIPAGGLLVKADGSMEVRGEDVAAGNFVEFTYTFDRAEQVNIQAPVVSNEDFEYADIPTPE